MPDKAVIPEAVVPWARVTILLASIVGGGLLSLYLTGSVVPRRPGEALVFQSGLLLIVLGSAVVEHKFTKPADSVVNGLSGCVTLLTVYAIAPRGPWWLVFAYCGTVFGAALSCSVVSTGPGVQGWKRRVADITYGPAVFFGKARLLHSVVFLFGVFTFYETGSRAAALLIVYWGLFLAIWPLGLPQLLGSLGSRAAGPTPVGRVTRREWPALIRVQLDAGIAWREEVPFISTDADGEQHLVIPLYKQVRDQQGIATALHVPYGGPPIARLTPGHVYELPADAEANRPDTNQALGGGEGSQLVGFVIEDSQIGSIRFETWRSDLCREGLLVWSFVAKAKVYYQITQGTTREESLDSDRLGSQHATAAQMGTLDPVAGFVKSDWLPTMNTPVFAEAETFGANLQANDSDDYVYGTVPGTALQVTGPFASTCDFHTAILGVTGSGKTELAFDLIRDAVKHGIKVLCIDLTARYQGRLADLAPSDLSLSGEEAAKLSAALFDAETGAYGAGQEKRALDDLRGALFQDICSRLGDFFQSEESGKRVGLITLDEISNTQATLVVTELFMTGLLNYARDHGAECPRTLVVVEEAHTVMPEAVTMGLGDYGSRGLVSKIAQIALQGRKYGVGLLVIAQRTATVSKSVLTQCNTVIALNSFDETTVGFLANVYGRSHAEILRDLPQLHAVVFGKGVRSQRPIIVQIPYDERKDQAGVMTPPSVHPQA